MATDAGLASEATSSGTSSGVRREYRFQATAPAAGGNVHVGVLRDGSFAKILVEGRVVVRVPSRNWRMWLRSPDSREAYLQPPLIMQRNTMGLWLQIDGVIAPTIVTRHLLDKIIELLED